MFKAEDVIGKKYNHLTVTARIPRDPGSSSRLSRVLARCDCGSEKAYFLANIKNGNTKSCGCGISEPPKRLIPTRSREYNAWNNMKQRCLNPGYAHYPEYGGRGIKICERWKDFWNFLADMGECHDGFAIGREHADQDYAPENCRWVDRKTLAKTRRPAKRS